MSFLPIVDRELRAASRRKSTYRVRWWTVIIAIFANFIFLLIASFSSGRNQAGQVMFMLLTWYTFGLSLLAGVFLTADCLSEEKRDGTLGLLFLTDMRGYDVVLGKFFARSLNACYGLVAILPIMGLPLLVGGVTGGEFWRVTLALLNALFFSLSAGIWVSSLTLDPARAMGKTLGLLLLVTAGVPGIVALIPRIQPPHAVGYLAFASPFYPFASAATGGGSFWGSLAASDALAWLWLALASIVLPRRWQDSPIPGAPLLRSRQGLRNFRPATLRKILRERAWLDLNPVAWLIGSEPVLRRVLWLIVAFWGVVAVGMAAANPAPNATVLFWSKGVGFALKMLLAGHVCRFFADSRRTGALELLLCTPLTNGQIIKGQWIAVRRIFLLPLLVFILLNFMPTLLQGILGILGGPGGGDAWVRALFEIGAGSALAFWFGLNFVADIAAIGWFGMWLGLATRKPNLAQALTILLVLVLPSIALCGLDLLPDLFFILWGATRLQQDFRRVLNR